eukprot:6444840-Lingulodinium_polyedra.AAC.1
MSGSSLSPSLCHHPFHVRSSASLRIHGWEERTPATSWSAACWHCMALIYLRALLPPPTETSLAQSLNQRKLWPRPALRAFCALS